MCEHLSNVLIAPGKHRVFWIHRRDAQWQRLAVERRIVIETADIWTTNLSRSGTADEDCQKANKY
jgi:hypothetical protein